MSVLDRLRRPRPSDPPPTAAQRLRDLVTLIVWVVPFAFYIPLSVGLTAHFIELGNPPGYDAWLYREAASAALNGSDPWSVGAANAHFPGAPSTIVAFVPATFIPAVVWQWLFVAACLVAGVLLIRHVRLSIAWLAYPPICTGIATACLACPSC